MSINNNYHTSPLCCGIVIGLTINNKDGTPFTVHKGIRTEALLASSLMLTPLGTLPSDDSLFCTTSLFCSENIFWRFALKMFSSTDEESAKNN